MNENVIENSGIRDLTPGLHRRFRENKQELSILFFIAWNRARGWLHPTTPLWFLHQRTKHVTKTLHFLSRFFTRRAVCSFAWDVKGWEISMQLLFSVTLFLSDSIARDPDTATPLLVAAPSACLCLWSGLVLLLLFQYAKGSVCILLFKILCFLVHLTSPSAGFFQ